MGGLEVKPDRVAGALNGYDSVFLPGGDGAGKLLQDCEFLAWIRGIAEGTVLTAVCGGTLALGAAGFLKGKEAATHPTLMKYLSSYAQTVSEERVVEDGNLITARGVTSAIDMGLCVKGSPEPKRAKRYRRRWTIRHILNRTGETVIMI